MPFNKKLSRILFAYRFDDVRPRDSISLNLKILNFLGLWFPEDDTWTSRKKLYILQAGVVQGIFFYLYVVSETMAMIKSFQSGDVVQLAEACFLLFTHYAEFFKITRFYNYQKKIVTFLNELDSEIFTPKNEAQRRILKRGMRRASHDSIILLSAGFLTCFLWSIFPFIETKEGDAYYRLPLSGWYPYDVRTGWRFAITFTYQIFGVTIDAFGNIAMDTAATGIFVLICSQLDMLKDSLEHMRANALESLYKKKNIDRNIDGINFEEKIEFTQEELEREMEQMFVKCVRHHYAIMEYAEEIENIFNMCFLAQYSASIVIICMTMFETTLIPSMASLQFVSIWLYQFCIVFELLLYSWHGNEMMLKSVELAEAAYKSEWYKFSPKFSRNIILIMARCKRPIEVTAGKFFALSLATFTGVLRLSWSYFAVLRSVHDE